MKCQHLCLSSSLSLFYHYKRNDAGWILRLCGTRGLQPYCERLSLLTHSTTVVMTSEVSLTGPGLQVHYSIFNLSDRKLRMQERFPRRDPWSNVSFGCCFLCVQLVQVSSCALWADSVSPCVTESRTAPTDWMRGTVVRSLDFKFITAYSTSSRLFNKGRWLHTVKSITEILNTDASVLCCHFLGAGPRTQVPAGTFKNSVI